MVRIRDLKRSDRQFDSFYFVCRIHQSDKDLLPAPAPKDTPARWRRPIPLVSMWQGTHYNSLPVPPAPTIRRGAGSPRALLPLGSVHDDSFREYDLPVMVARLCFTSE